MNVCRTQKSLCALGAALSLMLAPLAHAGEELKLDELMARFGWDFATAEITSQKIADGFYVIFGLGGNIAVSIGEQGVLIVDDQFPQLMPRIEKLISELGGAKVDFVINTHWHFDHAAGNRALGPQGTWIISQANSRAMLERENLINMGAVAYRQRPHEGDALPVITFEDRMQVHFNGERIDLFHAGPAHTTGDTAVIFRGRNAVHLGDVFNNTGYPFIDADSGGDIDGMIAFVRAVLSEIPADATVIPGHGKVADVPTLERYVDMLQTVRDRVAAMIDEGKSVEEVAASNPTADFSESYGDVSNSLGFVDRVYTSLKKRR